MTSEFEFINQLRQRAARSGDDLACGIGDDAAIVREQSGRETLVTADLLIEDVHFKLDYTPLRCLGHKALAVSLSDVAAMGGQPNYALLTLGIPKTNLRWEDFFAGYFGLAEKYGVRLIGGDTSASPDRLVIDSIVLGSASSDRAVQRSGACVGDQIYLTGQVGAAATGLELLRRGARWNEAESSLVQQALRAHLMPEPRCRFGRILGESGLVHAMLDVSDGLAQDLRHICTESGVNAVLDFDSVPISPALSLVVENHEAAFALAVSGGEDYELVLTAEPQAAAELMALASAHQTDLTPIGEIIERPARHPETALKLRRKGRLEPLDAGGYDHFK